ncbi:MAG: quinone oxidoreductase, partial [Pseudomonadota bacterium]
MTHAVVVEQTGGPQVLVYTRVPDPSIGPGQLMVRHTAIGLNYIDTYFRAGHYPAPNGLPMVLGHEAAGVVEAVGEGVSDFAVGDRVAYSNAMGAYCERRAVDAASCVKLPETISDTVAAAMMLKGMTARYLLRQTYTVEAGTTLLFHAAAGGVGSIAGQWAKALGASAIGTVSTPKKAEEAAANGYAHVIDYSSEDVVARVRALTDGEGVDVVYDSVGKDTYPASLDCLRPRGLWVSFGQSSGFIDTFDLQDLARRGSLFATRPTLFHYIATREALQANADELFGMVGRGAITIHVGQ